MLRTLQVEPLNACAPEIGVGFGPWRRPELARIDLETAGPNETHLA